MMKNFSNGEKENNGENKGISHWAVEREKRLGTDQMGEMDDDINFRS